MFQFEVSTNVRNYRISPRIRRPGYKSKWTFYVQNLTKFEYLGSMSLIKSLAHILVHFCDNILWPVSRVWLNFPQFMSKNFTTHTRVYSIHMYDSKNVHICVYVFVLYDCQRWWWRVNEKNVSACYWTTLSSMKRWRESVIVIIVVVVVFATFFSVVQSIEFIISVNAKTILLS